MKIQSETLEYLNGKLISHNIESKTFEPKWVSLEKNLIFEGMNQNIGIGVMDLAYIEINDIQDKNDEYKKITKFLNKYIKQYAENVGVKIEDLKLEFINYGQTELVYVLTNNKNGDRITLLVKQPAVQFGKIKQEAENLIELKQRDDSVISPIDYYQYGDYELYVTPYINQARCVASYETWGMYIPEPFYRFESFTSAQESIVNLCMIAKLVSLYDFEKEEGICKCKLGGGDFILPKGWETQKPTVENTLNNLYLIAAREKVHCSFEEYLTIIKKEFSRSTICENQEELIINLRGRVPMKIGDIELGIQIGQEMIKNNKNAHIKK